MSYGRRLSTVKIRRSVTRLDVPVHGLGWYWFHHEATITRWIGWYWFHHEATITRDVPVESVGTSSITRRPLHGMFLWNRLVLVPSRGNHYTGCSCGIGWYWFHHEATITRDVLILWTRLVLVPSRGDHLLYSTFSCHFLLVSLTLVSVL